MATFNFAVFSNPVPGKEQEYNDWYSNQHIHDLVRVPQISSARRYEVTPDSEKAAGRLGFRYLALYEAEAGGAEEIAAGIAGVREREGMATSEAIDRAGLCAVYFEELASTGMVEEPAAGADRYVLIVLANALEGRDDEFNRWYSEQHIHDVAKVPGIVRARRYQAADASREAADKLGYRYAAVYDVATSDLSTIPAGMAALAGRGEMPMSDAMAGRPFLGYFREVAAAT